MKKITLLLTLFITSFACSVNAFVASESGLDVLEYRPDRVQRFERQPTSTQLLSNRELQQRPAIDWQVRWDANTGNPARIRIDRLDIVFQDPEMAAYHALKLVNRLYNVDLEQNVKLLESHLHHGIHHFRFQQYHQGYPVDGAQLLVHVRDDGQVRYINGPLYPVGQIPPQAALTDKQAISYAEKDMRMTLAGLKQRPGPKTPPVTGLPTLELSSTAEELVILPLGEKSYLCWTVETQMAEPPAVFLSFIDAATGDLRLRTNIMRYGYVHGQVYELNPDEGPRMRLPFRDEYVYDAQNREYTTDIDGRHGASGVVTSGFTGPYAEIINLKAEEVTYNGVPDWDWNFAVSDTHFDETMAFFHANRYHDWIKQEMMCDEMDFVMRVEVNYGSNYANASYSNRTITMGTGAGRDPTHECDVLYHEYTHGVVDEVTGFTFYGSTGSLHEAFADFLPASFTNDSRIGSWWSPPYIRDLDNDKMFPLDNMGEYHAEGEVYAAGLWDLREELGDSFTNTIFNSLYYCPRSASFLDARDALLQADRDDSGGQNENLIIEKMADHGIGGVRILSVTIDDSSGNGNGIADPGETIFLDLTVIAVDKDYFDANYTVTADTNSTCLEIINADSVLMGLMQGVRKNLEIPIEIYVDTNCSVTGPQEIAVSFSPEWPYTMTKKVVIDIAEGPAIEVDSLNYYDIYTYPYQSTTTDPGKFILLQCRLTNNGTVEAEGVKLLASATGDGLYYHDAYDNIFKGYPGFMSYGTINAGATKNVSDRDTQGFTFAIRSDLQGGEKIDIRLDIFDRAGHRWSENHSIDVNGRDRVAPLIEGARTNTKDLSVGDQVTIETFIYEAGPLVGVDAEITLEDGTVLETLSMNDNGQDGDVHADDRWYSVTYDINMVADFYVNIVAEDLMGNTTKEKKVTAFTSKPFAPQSDILVVSFELRGWSIVQEEIVEAMDGIGINYDLWNTVLRGPMEKAILKEYQENGILICSIYHDFSFADSAEGVIEFLDKGGKMLISSAKIAMYAQYIGDEAVTFVREYLHAELVDYDSAKRKVRGVDNDPVSSKISFELRDYFHGIPAYTDVIRALRPSVPVYFYYGGIGGRSADLTGGLRVEDSNYALVYLSYGIESVKDKQSRQDIINRAIRWLRGNPPEAPQIKLAGYWLTQLDNTSGGTMQLHALPMNPDVESMELYIAKLPTGTMLTDDGQNGDMAAGDGIFGIELPFGPGAPAGSHLLQLRATTDLGYESTLWPYLVVK